MPVQQPYERHKYYPSAPVLDITVRPRPALNQQVGETIRVLVDSGAVPIIIKGVRSMTRPAIHPGEILAEELQELDMSANELAGILRVPASRSGQRVWLISL